MKNTSIRERIREKYLRQFEKAYENLNPQQKQAVDLIDGPVMVLAGPGTGKTQILSFRIGNILKHSAIDAYNILCLTFTEAGTIAMRKRLVQIIGPEGHKVHVHTFHGFCNQVIQENQHIFGEMRQLEPLTDLEKVDVYQEIIDNLRPDHILARPKSGSYYEAKRLDNLFRLMKKDNLSKEKFHRKIDSYIEGLKQDTGNSNFFYQQRYRQHNAGDPKPRAWSELNRKMDTLRAAIELFSEYTTILERQGRYDYEDMILWVLNAFKTNADLLATYQERYLYFLVDEYQDTNGAQNEVLKCLITFNDDPPNAFVVGDDDQAIFKFQGANIGNIKDFYDIFHPEVVVLKENYRSSQPILDASMALIEYNNERIVSELDQEITKKLVASGRTKDINNLPRIREFENIVQEQAYIMGQIIDGHDRGDDLSNVAILYRNHNQVAQLVEVLEKKGIPINIKRKVNILGLPIIKNILNILFYIEGEYVQPNSQEHRLFEIMHYHFFGIHSDDVARIAIFLSQKTAVESVAWRDLIGDEAMMHNLGLKALGAILSFNDLLNGWLKDIPNTSLQTLFGNILNKGKVLETILKSPDKTWLLQVVSTLFDAIKEETKKNPRLNLTGFLDIITKMEENDLPLEVNKIVYSERGVHFITTHSAKGLEFDTIYLIGCTDNVWKSKSRGHYEYSYPSNVNKDSESNDEDERRLFYVAMTRAESSLNISYARQTENGKDLNACQFINEITSNTGICVEKGTADKALVTDFQYYTLINADKTAKLIDHDWIDKMLEGYKLSVTALNKYLTCPLSFYFENILQVPTARSKYMGFGRAIHKAFQDYHENINNNPHPDLGKLIRYFNRGMEEHKSHFTEKEFEDLSYYGKSILTAYFNEFLTSLPEGLKFKAEVPIDKAEYKGIPIKGILDKVTIKSNSVVVIDYKTGNYAKPDTRKKLARPSEKNPIGGDYWRQMVFYKILLDNNTQFNWFMTSGVMDFVEPDKNTGAFSKTKYTVSDDEITTVGEQIEESWTKIHNHEFENGCGDDKCIWCSFVRNNYVFDNNFPEEDKESI